MLRCVALGVLLHRSPYGGHVSDRRCGFCPFARVVGSCRFVCCADHLRNVDWRDAHEVPNHKQSEWLPGASSGRRVGL